MEVARLLKIFTFMLVSANVLCGRTISNYVPFTGWGTIVDNSNEVIILRQFSLEGHTFYLTLNPHELMMKIIRSDSIAVKQVSWELLRAHFTGTPYIRALQQAAMHSDTLQDAGFVGFRNSPKGINFTVDLCPSQRPLDRVVFTELISEIGGIERPVPVGVSVTGRWISRHPEDLYWLDSLSRTGDLDITWINHSFNHYMGKNVPLNVNFMLTPGTDIIAEVLNTEIALLQKNIIPSPFFRFPGLVSDQKIFSTVLNLGLIPIGSDAWLAKGQWPKDGSIVLIHANGNEPLGVREFIDLLNRKRKEVLSKQWELLDLRKSIVDEESDTLRDNK
jgi:hypothetical protein